MGITLIVNPGSSSKKFALYQGEQRLVDAYVESSSDGYVLCVMIKGTQQQCSPLNRHRFHDSLMDFLTQATDLGLVRSLSEIDKAVVRVVAPGTFFQEHREIDKEYIQKLKDKESLAPLHIPHLLKEISVIKDNIPRARLIGASDSAFHSTIPDYIRNYSLPTGDVADYDLHRFGYHGLSVASVFHRVHAVTGVEPKSAVVCHIGSGVSVTAIKEGKSMDNSMGYAPGSGAIMSNRSGDVDVGVLLSLMQAKNLKPIDAETYLQSQGGLLGMANENDLRILLERRAQGDELASKTIDSFVYHIKKNIGAYAAVLGGLDMLIFTATASQRSSVLRSLVTKNLNALNITIDDERNELCIGKDGVISPYGADVKVVVIKTDESDEMYKISKQV